MSVSRDANMEVHWPLFFLSMMSRVSRHSSLVLTGLVFVFVVWDGKAVRSAVRD